MSTLYHISPDTNRPNICRAQSPDACPLKDSEGNKSKHFEDKVEAKQYGDKLNENKYGLFPTGKVSKKSKIQKPATDEEVSSKLADKNVSLDEKRALLKSYISDPKNREYVDKYFAAQNDTFEGSRAQSIIENGGNNIAMRKALREVQGTTYSVAEFLTELDQQAYSEDINSDQFAPRIVENAHNFGNTGPLLSDDQILYGDPDKLGDDEDVDFSDDLDDDDLDKDDFDKE